MAQRKDIKEMCELAKSKFSDWRKIIWPNREALEQATPEKVALYRASRIKGRVAADLCCGIGIDAIAIARNFDKVYAVDIDEKAIECARKNAWAAGIKNIDFVCGDYRKFDLEKIGADFVFADPSRRVNGHRVKGLDETAPNTNKIIEFIRESKAGDFCIEVSNAADIGKLPEDCEKEITSVDHEPNCISLYFGKLKKCNYSAVVLPAKARLEADEMTGEVKGENKVGNYLFEIDKAIVEMGLQGALIKEVDQKGNAFFVNEKFMSAEHELKDDFFRNSFEVLSVFRKKSEDEVIGKLKELNAGKVVLRGNLDPNAYFEIKKGIEAKLSGNEKLHIFYFDEFDVICKNTAFK